MLALTLGAVGMKDGDGVIVALEQMCDAISPMLGAAENKHRLIIDAFE